METEGKDSLSKRMKLGMDENEQTERDETALEMIEKEEAETNTLGSEEMQMNIAHIFEKMERYTQMVSELLESGKAMFKEMSNDFEERVVMLHKEQMEKWNEEIKELRMIDASNEETNAVLHNAKCLIQNPAIDS